jgi:hypothetical protein
MCFLKIRCLRGFERMLFDAKCARHFRRLRSEKVALRAVPQIVLVALLVEFCLRSILLTEEW